MNDNIGGKESPETLIARLKKESLLDAKISTEPGEAEKIYLFLSYDLCDFTILKANNGSWIKIIQLLINNKYQGLTYWKYNGDEMLYADEAVGLQFVVKNILSVRRHLLELQQLMREVIPSVSIKATMWLAKIMSLGDENDKVDDFSPDDSLRLVMDGSEKSHIDYVGSNIDEGFRLTGCTSSQMLAIDPKICYLMLDHYLEDNSQIYEVATVLHSLYFIGYRKCKGVWNNRLYPIYWYAGNDFDGDIEYDLFFENQHLYKSGKAPILRGESKKDAREEREKLEKIFKSIGILVEVKKMKELLNDSTKKVSKNVKDVKINLYYMVICYNPESHKVMIVKRSDTRQHLKGVWDFGNVKLHSVEMEGLLQKEYQRMFNITIELEVDEERGGNLKPFGCCTIYRNNKKHSGILCYAKILDKLSDEELIEKIKDHCQKDGIYSDVRFVGIGESASYTELNREEVEKDSKEKELGANKVFEGEKTIMYFESSVKKAIRYYQKKND